MDILFHSWELMENTMQGWSDLSGLPVDQFKCIFSMLIVIPLSFLFRFIQGRQIRLFYSFSLGIFFTVFLYGRTTWQAIAFAVVCYFIIKVLDRKAGYYIFIFVLSFMSAFHMYRMWNDWGGWTMDITLCLMYMVAKISLFAWSYTDGGRNEKDMSDYQNEMKLVELPSLYEYLSYLFFFPGSISGPSFDYKDFDRFMDLEGIYSDIPINFGAIGLQVLQGLGCSVLYLILTKYYPASTVYAPSFKEFNLIYRCKYSPPEYLVISLVYHVAFKGAEIFVNASIVACGIGYNGTGHYKYRAVWPWTSYIVEYENAQRWDRMEQLHLDYDCTGNAKVKIAKWNISISKWLRHAVYERLIDYDAKQYSGFKGTTATFYLSAFWHGFYPCYYVTFFHMGLTDHMAKSGFKLYNSKYLKPYQEAKGFYILEFIGLQTMVFVCVTIFSWYGTFLVEYFGMIFTSVRTEHLIAVLTNFQLSGTFILIGTVAFFEITGIVKKKRKPKEHKEQKEQKQHKKED